MAKRAKRERNPEIEHGTGAARQSSGAWRHHGAESGNTKIERHGGNADVMMLTYCFQPLYEYIEFIERYLPVPSDYCIFPGYRFVPDGLGKTLAPQKH